MGVISDLSKLSVDGRNHICYEGKNIGKWWGKTLFYFDPKTKNLRYENFSFIGIFLHIFGYKKEYNKNDLKQWLLIKNVKINPPTDKKEITEKVVLQALRLFTCKLKQFTELCCDSNSSEDAIIQLFKDGLSVNATVDECDTTVLHTACRRGRYEVAKYLIQHGATINSRTTEGSGYVAQTPLQDALQLQHEKLIMLLLENGADVNTRNCYGDTVLHQAIDYIGHKGGYYPGKEESNPKKIIRELLARNAKVNESGRNGETPLYKACEKGELDVAQWLVEKGADVNGFGKYGKPPLFAAIDQGHSEVVRLLFALGANPKPQEPEPEKNNLLKISYWETPMKLAVGADKLADWKPNPEMVKLLHEKGADINQKAKFQQNTPLHIAARRGDLDTVKLLISLGADGSIKNREGETPADAARVCNRDREVLNSPADIARLNNREQVANYLQGLHKVQ